MREIKFRAWNKDAKKMIEFDFLDIITDSEGAWVNPNGTDTNVAVCEVMQFTGLKDKNGKEIYEGDIVKYWRFSHAPVDAGNYKVEWRDGIYDLRCLVPCAHAHCVGTFLHKRNEAELEIIGDIYQNPELLGV